MNVVIVTLLSTFCIQLGFLLWKMAADSLPQIGKDKLWVVIKGFLCNWKWMLGYFATVLGWLLFIKANDIGEISLIQPLVSVGDVFLVLMAIYFLKERLAHLEWLGLGLIVCGAGSLTFDVKEVPVATINWQNIFIFMGFAIFAWIGLMLSRKGNRAEIILALAVGVLFGIGGVLTKLMTAYIEHNGQKLESFAFALNPVFPVMVVANVYGLFLLQMAFQNGRASVIIPVQLAVVNGMSVLAGMILFSETISVYRIGCILLIIVGTIVLQWAGSKKKSGEFLGEEKALTIEKTENKEH
jgi:uncharacterized membrane protein